MQGKLSEGVEVYDRELDGAPITEDPDEAVVPFALERHELVRIGQPISGVSQRLYGVGARDNNDIVIGPLIGPVRVRSRADERRSEDLRMSLCNAGDPGCVRFERFACHRMPPNSAIRSAAASDSARTKTGT